MQGSSNEPAKCGGVSATTNGNRFTISRNLDEHSPRPGSVSTSIKHDYQTSHRNHSAYKVDELERLQDQTQTEPPAHALTIQPTTSKTHQTNRNTETSAARLAALGEPIDYDYDYRS